MFSIPSVPRRLSAILALFSGAALAAGGCNNTPTARMNATIPTTGLAVIGSDYSSTVVSLIDPVTRALVRDDCVDSNTVPPTLSLTLSGDVLLASRPQVGGDLLLIDDVNSALTWVDPQTCAIRHQLSVGDFLSFPHDVISIDDRKAYVTRFGTNANPTTDPMSRGDDLLIIDPKADGGPGVVGRIDLAPFAATVAGGAPVEARPDSGLLVGDKVYVTLGSQSADYSATGEGRVVIVDTTIDQVSGMIPLAGLAGCARLDYLAASQTLLVACGGASSDLDQSATAGLALVDLGVTPPAVKAILLAAVVGGQPLNFSWVAPFSANLVFAATFGAMDFTTKAQLAPDAVWAIVPGTGAVTKLIEGGAYNLGRAAMLASPGTLFVPDADTSRPLIHLFTVSATGAVAAGDLDANPSTHLSPRAIAWY
jgi:hypothetical protein